MKSVTSAAVVSALSRINLVQVVGLSLALAALGPVGSADAQLASPQAESAAAPATPAALAAPEPPHARLDYSDGAFYLRSIHDNLVLVPSARAHIDVYSFGGPEVASFQRGNGTGLKTNLLFRRFILEMGGIVRKKWFFWMGGNFAPTQVDANQAPMSTANVYDLFLGYLPLPNLRIYAGQYNAPVTMENVTSSRWMDFMERALMVRTLATPYNKSDGIMFWGNTPQKGLEFQAGGFGGDGMNRPNIDNRFDAMARIVFRPLASRRDALQRLHVGASGRYGSRDAKFVRYDAPALSTPGGYTFWSPVYGSGAEETHILPEGPQGAVGGELYVPFERFDVRGEGVYLHEGRREVLASDRSSTLRTGKFEGYGAYAQLSFWLLGTPRLSGNPAGMYGVAKVPTELGPQAPFALQLVLRGEVMRMNYRADGEAGESRLATETQNIDVNAYQAALNYWATKHVRLTCEYSLYQFPGTPLAAEKQATNQAAAPGASHDPAANVLHEISFRLGLSL